MGRGRICAALAAAVLGLRWAQGAQLRTRSLELDSEVLVAEKDKKQTFTEEKCQAVVAKVAKSKSYTEESIKPICDKELQSSRCDFFAESLALASTHSDFDDGKAFCQALENAEFCALSMDRLLSSTAMADLARGECNRAEEKKGRAYCEKFQKMVAYSVQSDDLDTMRACYMMEAYAEVDGKETSKDKESSKEKETSPKGNSSITTSPAYLPEKNEHVPKTSSEAQQMRSAGTGTSTVAGKAQPAASVSSISHGQGTQPAAEVRLSLGLASLQTTNASHATHAK